jgi:hypothetical protein
MKKDIKICYSKFWDGFNYKECPFYLLLSKNYNVTVSEDITEDLDILFVSVYKYDDETFKKYLGTVKVVSVCFENFYPNFNSCDYSISLYNIGLDRNLRVPVYWYHSFYEVYKQYQFINEPNFNKEDIKERTNDIGVVISNPCRDGIDYLCNILKNFNFKSGGKLYNNIQINQGFDSKIELFKTCKFGIAFENSVHDDYITEKIYDCYLANVIPIYFGARNINTYFNPESFINVQDYNNIDDLINRIKFLMDNEDAYLDMLNKKRLIKHIDYTARCEEFLINIIENGEIYNHINGAINWLKYGEIYRIKKFK